jgi:hypothetical protein
MPYILAPVVIVFAQSRARRETMPAELTAILRNG